MDTEFVLHQPLCPPQCPGAGVKEALAALWGWQNFRRWAGPTPGGGTGGENRRGEEKAAKDDMANDGARSWDQPLSTTKPASPGPMGTAHGNNCQDTSDPESNVCTPKIRTPAPQMVKHPLQFWHRMGGSQQSQGIFCLGRVISARNGASWHLLLFFLCTVVAGVPQGRGQGHGGGSVPIPGVTAPCTPLCYGKPGSLLAETHPTVGPPRPEPAALISLKGRASSSRACSSHGPWSSAFLQGKT